MRRLMIGGTVTAIGCAVAFAACIPTGAVRCPDGKLCADGTTCVEVRDPDEDVCATPDQLAACAGAADHVRCGGGRCYSGVCLAIACGNGRLDSADPDDPDDRGEVCDDGNQMSGDGCSGLCDSSETCGNGVVDLIKGELCDDGNRIQHDGCDSTCQPEAPRWIELPSDGPGVLVDAAMAFDSDRQRVVLFGGYDSAGLPRNDTWEWNGAGWIRMSPPSSPAPRSGHVMAYDPNLRRVVMFGGASAEALGDTWTWDGTSWTAMAPATVPVARLLALMWFDGHHVVMAGGSVGDDQHPVNDMWSWDGADWTRLPVDVPLDATAAAFDPARGRTVLLDTHGATWELDGASWIKVAEGEASPLVLMSTAMTYDPSSRAVMRFGGRDFDQPIGGHSLWNGTSWIPVAGTPPSPRFGHAMVTDLVRGRVVMFGGTPDASGTLEWDGSTWSGLSPVAMPHVENAPFAYNPRTHSTHLLVQEGGTVSSYQFDGTSWQPGVVEALVSDLTTAAMTFDEVHGLEVLVAGDQTYTIDGGSTLQPVAAAPPARSDAGFGFDGQRAIMFGGNISQVTVDETWAWDGSAWTQPRPAHSPSPRFDMAIGGDPIRNQIVVFGGIGTDTTLGDTWVWDGTDWSERATKPSPPACAGARMTWDPRRRRLVMFGGYAASALSAVWEWDGATWSRVAVANAPPGRHGEAWFPVRDGLVAFSGAAEQTGHTLGDTWLLRWDNAHPDESCHLDVDDDGDGLAGCADPDCWSVCTPACPPGSSCEGTAPHCGDGVCDGIEDCRICPADCTCTPVCGDFICDPGEDHVSCPGDC